MPEVTMWRARDAKNGRRTRSWLIVNLICLMMTSVVADFELVILHTNDVHARVEESNRFSSRCSDKDAAAKKCFGGVARRMTVINEARRNYSNVLLLDAGDEHQGTVWSLQYGGLEASYFMNQLKYDAMTLGNHEFDTGADGLVPFLNNVSFPIVCANLDTSREPKLRNLIEKSTILTVGGQRIGIVGYITKNTQFLVAPDRVKTIGFKDELPSIREEVATLKKAGVDKIIALGHAGYNMDKTIAKELKDIDIVVGGHTNTFLYSGEPPSIEKPEGSYPTVVSQATGATVLVVEDYAFGKYLGFLRVIFDDAGNVKDYSGNPILLDGSIVQDAEVQEKVAEWKVPLDRFSKTVVGKTYTTLQGGGESCREAECSMGNLLTDSLIYEFLAEPSSEGWTRVALAVWNGGGVRAPIPQGDITLVDILAVLPFRTEVTEVQLKGEIIRQMFEHSADTDIVSGRFLQMSGIRVSYNMKRPVGKRVVDISVQCAKCEVPEYEPLDDDEAYGVYLSKYMYNGGDGYSIIAENALSQKYVGSLASDVVTNYVKKRSPITVGVEGRIRFVDDVLPAECPTSTADRGTVASTIVICLTALLLNL